jgi:serine phosphatase RsbU (regulator of sigma subunit)
MEPKKLSPVLYVDDEEDNLIVFKSTFRRDFDIFLASSGKEGIEILKNHEIHLIITDQRMPEMTGIQFLEKILPDYPDCIRMILTGFSDIEAIIQAINTGRVYRYITKPWNKEELKMNIDRGLEAYGLREQNRKLIQDLKIANQTLEEKVIERTRRIEQQNIDIMASIRYAGRIQTALMPPEEELRRSLPEFFILSKPCEIVSGDYYWVTRKDEKTVLAVADCTGHGVPGAFMSILGVAFLNEIINKTLILRANEILNQLSGMLVKSLHQKGDCESTRDGMEMALCIIDYSRHKLQYSGAFRPLYLIRDESLSEYRGDSMPVGIYELDEVSFTNIEIQFLPGDLIYIFSDGYVDQLGGGERKTFRSERFRKLLLEIHKLPMADQKIILNERIEAWKGQNEQIDDILVTGIRL